MYDEKTDRIPYTLDHPLSSLNDRIEMFGMARTSVWGDGSLRAWADHEKAPV